MQLTTKNQKHGFCMEALNLKRDIEINFLALGAMLARIQKEKLWEAGWESEDLYHMEFKMSPATISRLIRIYEIFHLQYGIPQKQIAEAGGWSVVAEYLPLVKESTTKKEVERWLGGMAEMTRADIRRTITEAKKGTDMTKCKHPNSYLIRVCPDCGERERVYDKDN